MIPFWRKKKSPPRGGRHLDKDDPLFGWWEKADRVADVTPIYMENGGQVTSLTCTCRTCGYQSTQEETRVEVRNRDPLSYWVRVVGLCVPCRTMHGIVFELGCHDHGGFYMNDITKTEADPFVRVKGELP
jgi:hypothetical protein